MNPTRFRTLESPIGLLTLAGRDGRLTHLVMDRRNHQPVGRDSWVRDDGEFTDVVTELKAYFLGQLEHFTCAMNLEGTAFQLRVWRALEEIPYGETRSYGEVAASIGQPTASRAVGMANARNPIAVIIPCHRVIGANGALTGYDGGLERKRVLLDLERSH